MNYLIGIDLGTSSTKTVLFDEDGNVIASAGKDYPLYTPNNGWAVGSCIRCRIIFQILFQCHQCIGCTTISNLSRFD